MTPIKDAQYQQAAALIASVEQRQLKHARLTEAVTTYLNNGEMSTEVQELLRPWLADKLQARLDAFAAGIASDVATIKTIVTDFV